MRNHHSFNLLLEANEKVKKRHEGSKEQWRGSPFEWLVGLPSRTVGAIGEALVENWLRLEGFEVGRSGNSNFDRWCSLPGAVRRLRLEIKFSTLWNNGVYVFQQIRMQDYDFLFFLGISPNCAHAWAVPKSVAWSNCEPQHGGQRGRDTRWCHVRPDSPPGWLIPYGGDLEKAVEYLRRQLEADVK